MLIKGMVLVVKLYQIVWVVDLFGVGCQVIVWILVQIKCLVLCLEYLFSLGDCVSYYFYFF